MNMEATEPRINAIGYEGVSIDEFLNCLQKNNIELVIDVRANPISRKKGFSKTALQLKLSGIGVGYIHFPQLGIPSKIRKQSTDINELLDYYNEEILPKQNEAAKEVARFCKQYKATILCFEADPELCHRSRLARYIEKNFDVPLNFIKYD